MALIARLKYARYFLTVHDVVAYARKQLKILCQGRGSAANSAVCYCLGITEVNPNESKLLFARFISENRNEPPDIDVDFEHERREEVIQYIYKRYGRDRAAICATVMHYRSRRAIREVGKAMGLTEDITAALAKTVWGYGDELPDDHIRQAGLDPANPAIRQAVALANALTGFPRHLSQHVGGFVLTRGPLDETVPIGNAAMDERTFIEWDKDDIDTLGLMKVDVLALGMLSCLRRGLELLKTALRQGVRAGDAAAGRSSCGLRNAVARRFHRRVPGRKPRADVDAAATQAAMFLRSRHRSCDRAARTDPGRHGASLSTPARQDLKNGKEHLPVSQSGPGSDKDELKDVLKRTLGVPLFQEQAMQIAIRRQNSLRTKPMGFAAPWRPSATTARFICSATNSSTA